ncbi:sensor histidine kinase [Nocardioides panacisoli]|uniref:sensor histidine kinase n=1 Tax=Nocardioides panacisoli TaxID=627624 RepID=UPI001C6260CB|nr:sensor histidine kinase [Nocardioides panacisoli]QYJ02782.1 sensor histidine kinase [Nocardioides panacisoli]
MDVDLRGGGDARRTPQPGPAVTDSPHLPPSPWARWGWAMSAVWLIFLAFPVVEVLTGDLAAWQQVVGLVLLVSFAGVYLHAFTEHPPGKPGRLDLSASAHLGLLVAHTAGLVVLDPAVGVGTLPFLGAIAVFTMRALPAGVVVVAAMATPPTLAAAGVADWGALILTVITGCVAIVCTIVRVIDSRDDVWRQARRDYDIVAERERVARDVHDVLGHSLTVLAVKAELAERMLDRDPERTRHELQQIQSLTRESMAEIRATVAGLRVARLADELVAARAALADAGIDAEVPTATDAVDPRHRLVLAWVVREAVTNVVRHSGAQRCEVVLASNGLRVVDDGVGPAGSVEGTGLRGLRERVAAAGGRVDIGAGDQRGTVVEVEL